jgi:NADH-quinone oxidoreductase subunit C
MAGPLEKTPDMEGMTPAERAAEYKRRAAAAGIGQAPSAASAAAPAPAPAASAQPAAAERPPAEAAAPTPAPAAAAPLAEKPAAPAPAKPAPPPEPEKPRDPVFVTHLLEKIPGASWQWRHGYAEMKVPSESLLAAARLLRDEGFDYLSFVTEVDWGDRFGMVYHLFSYDYERQPLGAILRTELPRDGMPAVASLTAVWPGAEFMEREAYEMMGIRFLGHPDLRKILLPDDFVGFPMRKDYETDFDYVTVRQLVPELRND